MKALQPETKTITSIADAITVAVECCGRHFWAESDENNVYKPPFGIWYRGQVCAESEVMPSVFRPKTNKHFDETALFHHFQLRSPTFRGEHHSVFEWLCLMQHYGAPTRLLDWTENVLVGLYFCVNEPEHDTQDGALYALNARLLNEDSAVLRHSPSRVRIHVPSSFNTVLRSFMACHRGLWQVFASVNLEHFTSSDSPNPEVIARLRTWASLPSPRPDPDAEAEEFLKQMRKPVAVFPYRTTSRLVAQAGAFTIHGGKIDHEDPLAGDSCLTTPERLDHDGSRLFLKKYQIPHGAKKTIREELNYSGIHIGTLFAELDKQAEYMKELWLVDERKI